MRDSCLFSFRQWRAAAFVFLLTVTSLPNPAAADRPADPDASANTITLLKYLTALPHQSTSTGHSLISGQWVGMGSLNNDEIQYIGTITSQLPGLVGADYCERRSGITPGNVNPSMIDYWNKGTLVDIDILMPNPLTGGSCFENRTTLTPKQYAEVITPGMAAHKAYMANLELVAAGLQELQAAGVVVLFRPLREMDGNWNWYNGSPADFKTLWIQTFNYLTNKKGLHNLLWVFSTATDGGLNYYPGSQYVDIVGYDTYGYGNGKTPAAYNTLLKTGKPYALTEFGLQGPSMPGTYPAYDLNTAISNIKNFMPEAVYFMNWSSGWQDTTQVGPKNYWAIDAQINAAAALNRHLIQNRPVPWNVPSPASP